MKSRILVQSRNIDVKTNGSVVVPPFDVSEIERLNFVVTLAALSGGTTPGIDFKYQEGGADGYGGVASLVGVMSSPATLVQGIGPGCAIPYCVGYSGRLTVVVTGAPTTATAHILVYGEPIS